MTKTVQSLNIFAACTHKFLRKIQKVIVKWFEC